MSKKLFSLFLTLLLTCSIATIVLNNIDAYASANTVLVSIRVDNNFVSPIYTSRTKGTVHDPDKFMSKNGGHGLVKTRIYWNTKKNSAYQHKEKQKTYAGTDAFYSPIVSKSSIGTLDMYSWHYGAFVYNGTEYNKDTKKSNWN